MPRYLLNQIELIWHHDRPGQGLDRITGPMSSEPARGKLVGTVRKGKRLADYN
jgi:hypothetical protein